jgi:hypothetical protein
MRKLSEKPIGRTLESGDKKGWERSKTEEYARLHTSDRWKKLRELQLSEFPLCEIKNCDHPAVEVHRVDPKRTDLFYERINHRSICERHHKQIGVLLKMKQETKHLFKERN